METDGVTFYREAMVPVDDFISECLFAGEGIPCSELVDIVMTIRGLCYRLSTQNFPDTVFERPGHIFGIAFQLNVQEYEYGGQSQSPGVGVQVMHRIFECYIYL